MYVMLSLQKLHYDELKKILRYTLEKAFFYWQKDPCSGQLRTYSDAAPTSES